MIENILGWLTGATPTATAARDDTRLALAALLVEAGLSDGRFDAGERAVVGRLLERRFGLSAGEAGALLAAAEQEARRSAELFHFTRIINERLSPAERIELVEMLWEVAYADGVLDQYEDSLLRRIGGLVDVSDHERGLARRRAVARRGLDPTRRPPAAARAPVIKEEKTLP
jgi:uncharacterized tellurite resistance protein B-like protein